MFNLRSINHVRSQTPCATPVTCIQGDMSIHDLDRAMVYISIGLDQDLTVNRIIWNIRVSMTKKGYATITNERHHSVTPKLLKRKREIGLEKAKETLKATNQDNICSVLLPLTRIYRKYLFSQLIRRLLYKFYADNCFEK